jgi:geranylgeranyl pyrophosphate synthase
VVDDILDFTQTAEQLGKPQGQDLASGNLTAPAIFALANSEELRWGARGAPGGRAGSGAESCLAWLRPAASCLHSCQTAANVSASVVHTQRLTPRPPPPAPAPAGS